jgi:FKBP-type peptidyl-prolyl cis-trans isomerase SlyD
MKIARDTVVAIEYTLTNADGVVLDSSKGQPPLEYIHGAGNIIPGLERELEDLEAGAEKQVKVAAKDGYGEHDPRLVVSVPLDRFPEEDAVQVGMKFHAQMSDGLRVMRVAAIDNGVVSLDGNSELAGVELHFDVKVISVRAATAEEIQHGHLHQEGECCGGHGHHHHHHDDAEGGHAHHEHGEGCCGGHHGHHHH